MSLWSSSPLPVQTEAEAFWYLNLTADQQKAYDKFLAHLTETGGLLPGHDDKCTLLRFLKARQYDVQKAATMYSNMVKWRQEHNVNQLYSTFDFHELDSVFQVYPHFLHKMDKYGRPVYVELLGQTDPHKILELTTLERILNYHLCEWETLEQRVLPGSSAVAGKPIITKTVILDLKGLSMKNFGSAAQKILKAVAHMDQDYYPEHLGQMFIINTPLFFRAVWAVVNPLLEDRTRRKIIILGSDYLPTVTQLVPLENLPTQVGGKSVVKDMKVDEGPWIAALAELEAQGKVPPAPKHGGGNSAAATAATAATVTATTAGKTADVNGDVNGSSGNGITKVESLGGVEGTTPVTEAVIPAARTFSN